MNNRITRFGAFLLLTMISLRAHGQSEPAPSTALMQDLRGTDYDRLCWAVLYIEWCAGPKLVAIPEGARIPRFRGNQLVSKVLPKSESDAVRSKYRKWLESLRESDLPAYEKLEAIYLKEEQANIRSPYCTLLGALTSDEPESVLAALSFLGDVIDEDALAKYGPGKPEVTSRESVMAQRERPIKYLADLSDMPREALDKRFRTQLHWRSLYFAPTKAVIFRSGKGPHNSQ